MKLLQFFEATINESIQQVYQTMQIVAEIEKFDEFFNDMREAWVGGIADFGDPQAAITMQQHPQYAVYHEALVRAVTENLGDPFTAYRLMSTDQIEEWQSGADMPAIAVSTELSIAKAFRNLAANRGRDDLQVVQLSVPAEAVIMLGHSREHELVVDANHISANEVQFLNECDLFTNSRFSLIMNEARNPDVKVKKGKGGIYNAYLKGRRVGQAQVYDYGDERVGENERYIWKSATHPDYLRQGVATELYNVIADDLASKGLKLVPSPDSQLSGDAYQFWKARDPESIKGHGTYKAEKLQHYVGREVEVRGRPAVVTRVGWSIPDDAPTVSVRFTDVPEGSVNSTSYVRFADVADQLTEEELNLPDLETGDELMVGKFKNRKATIKGFKKDKHNQPVAKTDKGDQQIFKGRVKKLMDEDAFDRTSTEMPDYDDLIKSIGDEYKTDYFRQQKGKEVKMVDISPDEYLNAVDRGFEHGVMSGIDAEKVERYAEKMRNGETFPALTLDYSRGKRLSQEGRHRALAAKAVGIDSVPVLVVTPTQEEADYLGITVPDTRYPS